MPEIVNIFAASSQPKASTTFDTEALKRSFSEQRATDWTIGEAFMALHLSAVSADGRLSEEEHAELFALARRSRVLKTYTQDQLAQVNTTVSQRLSQRSEGLVEACESLPHDMRLTVFAHCVDLILADGELHENEADFLNKITAYLGIDRSDAERIQQVLLIKNRF